jgi:hypothetical protein
VHAEGADLEHHGLLLAEHGPRVAGSGHRVAWAKLAPDRGKEVATAYFIVRDGAIEEAFESLGDAEARARAIDGAQVIGEEWLTLAQAKHRVEQARMALDEVASLLGPEEVDQMRRRLSSIESIIDAGLARAGLTQA